MDKLMNVGAFLFVLGLLSFVLSLVGLQFNFMSFLGDSKESFDICAIVFGFIILVVASKLKKKKHYEEE